MKRKKLTKQARLFWDTLHEVARSNIMPKEVIENEHGQSYSNPAERYD